MGSKGFVSSVFDLSFQHYVTPKIVKVLYVLDMLTIGFILLLAIIAGFLFLGPLGVIILLIAPILYIAWLALIRLTFEFFMAIFTLAENSRRTVSMTAASQLSHPMRAQP